MARSVRPWRGQPAAVAVGIRNLRADGRQLILEIQRHGRELAAKLGLGRRDDIVEDRLPSAALRTNTSRTRGANASSVAGIQRNWMPGASSTSGTKSQLRASRRARPRP